MACPVCDPGELARRHFGPCTCDGALPRAGAGAEEFDPQLALRAVAALPPLLNPADHDVRGYRRSYLALRALFADPPRPLADWDWVLSRANAVYGWMPTILKGVCPTRFQHARPFLAAAIEDVSVALRLLDDSDSLQPQWVFSFVNGSVVGTSKFLHFLTAGALPIWDSRVAITLGVGGRDQIHNVGRYRKYVELVANLAPVLQPQLAPLAEFLTVDGVAPTPCRTLEYALFLQGPPDPDVGD